MQHKNTTLSIRQLQRFTRYQQVAQALSYSLIFKAVEGLRSGKSSLFSPTGKGNPVKTLFTKNTRSALWQGATLTLNHLPKKTIYLCQKGKASPLSASTKRAHTPPSCANHKSKSLKNHHSLKTIYPILRNNDFNNTATIWTPKAIKREGCSHGNL